VAKRIQRKRTKGWRMPEGAVYVGRPGRFGNPFTINGAVDAGFVTTDDRKGRAFVVDAFRAWLLRGEGSEWWFENGRKTHAEMTAHISELRGKDLACWCPLDQPCHADVLLEIANGEDSQ
jgi:hypothetical protein